MDRARLLDAAGFNQLAQSDAGYLLYNTHDVYIGRSIAKYGRYAGIEARFLERLCAPGDNVIEVGANIGAHTVALAKRVGPQGRVVAFEPQRLVFQALCANVALNSLANVDCHWAALGRTRGRVGVPELDPGRPANFGGVSLAGLPGRSVPCFTLDDFVSMPSLKLVKVDVEGMEQDVLAGGAKLLARHRPLLYVENDRVERSEPLMRAIDALGYRIYWHTPPLFDPHNPYGDREDVFPNVRSFNLLCVHRERAIEVAGCEPVADFTQHPLKR
jgi:FkbM family methyltransferase